jgi:hypothetical protein
MKNEPDPALSGGSYLFNEIQKRTPKSRETIPLNHFVIAACSYAEVRMARFLAVKNVKCRCTVVHIFCCNCKKVLVRFGVSLEKGRKMANQLFGLVPVSSVVPSHDFLVGSTCVPLCSYLKEKKNNNF